MAGHGSAVVVPIEVHLVGPDALVPLPAELAYRTGDPYAVRVRFQSGPDVAVEWVIARQLLVDGLDRPAGDGDVGIWPSTQDGREVACLTLSSPAGHALVVADADEVRSFIAQTEAAVPVGSEPDFCDLDTLIDELLAD